MPAFAGMTTLYSREWVTMICKFAGIRMQRNRWRMTGALPRCACSPASRMFGESGDRRAEKGVDFELIMVPFDMQRLYERSIRGRRINPKRQVRC